MDIDPTTNNLSDTSPSGAPNTRYDELKQLVSSMEQDFHRFFVQGNKAAGTRVRGAMQELKNLAQAIRTEVQTLKNAGGKTPS